MNAYAPNGYMTPYQGAPYQPQRWGSPYPQAPQRTMAPTSQPWQGGYPSQNEGEAYVVVFVNGEDEVQLYNPPAGKNGILFFVRGQNRFYLKEFAPDGTSKTQPYDYAETSSKGAVAYVTREEVEAMIQEARTKDEPVQPTGKHGAVPASPEPVPSVPVQPVPTVPVPAGSADGAIPASPVSAGSAIVPGRHAGAI